jgi:hypothetical protein
MYRVQSGRTGLGRNGELYRKDTRESMESMMNERPNSPKHESEYTLDEIATMTKATIKDSGQRREFETGAVRDIQEGKGRCDLMPLDVVGNLFDDNVLSYLGRFQESGNVDNLYDAIWSCCKSINNIYTALLETAKHFEEGAKKYGEYNWQKGIPTHCYIDSAVRHYLKWLRGDEDEPHERAFCWNILCCIWTCIHKPELNDIGG